MTLRSFLMWYIGAVVFVGAAGASGYQALMRLHAQSATETSAAAPSTSSMAMAEAQPQPQSATTTPIPAVASPPPAVPASAGASPPRNRPPPLRQHVAAAAGPALRAGKGVAEKPGAQQGRAHHPSAPVTTMAQRQAPGYQPGRHVAPRRPGAWYPLPPSAPPVAIYAYPRSHAYPPGYAYSGYGYPRYAYPRYAYPGYGYPGYPYPGYYAYRSRYGYYAGYPRYTYYQAF